MIVAVASGKGGTGKTTVAASLATIWDGPVLAVDLDVEEPNLHLFLNPAIAESEMAHMCEWKSNMVPVTAIQNGPTLVYCNTDRTSQSQAGASEPRAGGTPQMRAALGSPCL